MNYFLLYENKKMFRKIKRENYIKWIKRKHDMPNVIEYFADDDIDYKWKKNIISYSAIIWQYPRIIDRKGFVQFYSNGRLLKY